MGQDIYLSIIKKEHLKGKSYYELTEDEQVDIHNKSDTIYWLCGRYDTYDRLIHLFDLVDRNAYGLSYFIEKNDKHIDDVLDDLYNQRNELLVEHDKCVEAIKYNQLLMLASKSKDISNDAKDKVEIYSNAIKGSNDDCGEFWDSWWVVNRTIHFVEFAKELSNTEEFIKDYAIFISISY